MKTVTIKKKTPKRVKTLKTTIIIGNTTMVTMTITNTAVVTMVTTSMVTKMWMVTTPMTITMETTNGNMG